MDWYPCEEEKTAVAGKSLGGLTRQPGTGGGGRTEGRVPLQKRGVIKIETAVHLGDRTRSKNDSWQKKPRKNGCKVQRNDYKAPA